MRVRLKVCCIRSLSELQLAVRYGADAVGLVGAMPSGPGVISDSLIHDLAMVTPPPVSSVLSTSEKTASGIIAHIKRTSVSVAQLVRPIPAQWYADIRQAAPHVRIIQVVHVADEASIQLALSYQEVADALLLDSGQLNRPVEQLGGTGRTHNWKLSRCIVNAVRCPVFLAGGLTADNIVGAVQTVRPFGVDLCSFLRPHGSLDEDRLSALCRNLGKAH